MASKARNNKGKGKKNVDAKKKLSRNDLDDDTFDDAGSFDSPAVSESNDSDHVSDWSEKMAELVEALSEKRASTRVLNIGKLCQALRKHFLKDQVQAQEVTLTASLLASARKGAPAEVSEACSALSLTCLTLGQDSEQLFAETYEQLTVIAKDPKKPEKSRAAALSSLAMITFIGCNDDALTKQAMELCHTLYVKEAAGPVVEAAARPEDEAVKEKKVLLTELMEEALLSWGLLASSLRPIKLLTPDLPKMLTELGELLEGGSVETRTAAGENLAFIFTALLTLERRAALVVDEKSEDDKKETSGATTSAQAYVAAALNISELVEKLEELSTDSSHRKSKKDKRVQRQAFRQIVATLSDGDVPEETLQIGTHKHTLQGWSALRQLDCVRRALSSGLLVHMAQNELLSDIFGIDAAAGLDVGMSSQDKKNLRQEAISVSKQKQRAQKDKNQKNRKLKQAHIQADDE